MSALDRLALGAFVLLLLVVGASPGFAHTSEDYWSDTWANGDIAYNMTIGVPGGLGSNQHDQIAAGGQKWNALTGRITFKRSGNEVGNFDPFASCSPANSIHWIPLNAVASTIVCENILRTAIIRFRTAFNSNETWYFGTSGVPAGLIMVSGASGHEFGHAAGGWRECCNDIGHFDATNNPNLCANSVPLADLHTMCPFVDRFIGNNHQGSLEFHDGETFQHWYP